MTRRERRRRLPGMRIDVWSDVVCPFCWLGKARLDKALAAFDRGDVEVVFHSFELDPRVPKELDVPVDEALTKKLGVSRAQLEQMHARLRAQGLAEGIEYHFERARTANTFDAHQLTHLAREHGKQGAMVDRLFAANFRDGIRVADRAALVRLAAEVGLDEDEARVALEEQRFADAVRADETKARTLGVTGVPFFLFDEKLAVSGAQSLDIFRAALDRAAG